MAEPEENVEEKYDCESIRIALINWQGRLARIWPSMMQGYKRIEEASPEKLVQMAKDLAWDMEQFEKKKGLGK